MNALVPSFILLILLAASTTTLVVIFSASIHHVRLGYQGDVAKVNDSLRSVQSQQATYAKQVQALTKIVTESLNATDEYINNITSTVGEAKDVIAQDMATVKDIQSNQSSQMAIQFAGMFTILVILVSGYHLSQHLRHMHSPVVQRKIMAVLWMTPVYSLSSWLSLVFESSEPYLAVIREFYESYCVYMFLSFLIAVLGRGDRRAVITLLELRADQLARPDKCRCGPKFWKRFWNGCCNSCGKRTRVPNDHEGVAGVNNNSPGANTTNPNGPVDEYGNIISPERAKAEAVLDQCQLYAMQFVLLRPITAIGWLVSNQLFEPQFFLDYTCPQLYITIVTNGSIFFALRGLVRFYHATSVYLAWCNPWPKFLCIKGVVFMTFWQKMALSLIVNLGYADKFDTQEEANRFIMQAQNLLICLEMLFSAVAHCFVFSPDEWEDGYREKEEQRRRNSTTQRFGDSVALGDFLSDVKVVMASKKRRKHRKHKAQKGRLSPSSIAEDGEVNGLDLALSRSSGAESEDEGSLSPTKVGNRLKSAESMESTDGLDPDFDDAEYVMELATTSSAPRRRLDTGESVDSVGERGQSWARIEKFINEIDSPKPHDEKEIV